MVVLDANVWVAMLLNEEPRHDESESWLHAWMGAERGLKVPSLFVVEVGSAIARRRKQPAEGMNAIHDIRREPTVDIVLPSFGLWEAAAERAAQLLIRGADAVYVAMAEELRLPLVTWDQEILDRASDVIDVRTPDQMPI